VSAVERALHADAGAIAAPPRLELRLGRLRAASLPRPRPELLLLLALAAVLDLWALGQNGWANTYYSATVRSMSSSWHAFLYGSFDPSGVMTVDKPPLAFWVQALSVRVFGFHPLSMLVPQAVMGVASVALVYDLTRRCFGRTAGFVAGLALALTPITVAIARYNHPDSLLVLCALAAVWFLVRGLEDGRTRWVVLAGIAVGLGFEAKMAVALMVVPAIAAAWLWVAPRGRGRAVRQLLGGGAAMLLVGGAWPLLMALTPASSRPWISGTSDNSILSLILGYNGLGRLDGQAGGPNALGGGGGGGPFGGSTGPLRLLNEALGGQAGWLVGFALVSLVAIALASRLRRRDPRSGWAIAVGGAFLTTAVAFSFAKGIFHPYYVSMLAPFGAALVGAGAAQLSRRTEAMRVLGPLALLAGLVTELIVIDRSALDLGWLKLPLIVVAVAAAGALALRSDARVRRAVALAAVIALLVAPGAWAAKTVGHSIGGTFPAGGPAGASMPGGPGAFGRGGPAGGGAARGAGGVPLAGRSGTGPGAGLPGAGLPPTGAAQPPSGVLPGVGRSGAAVPPMGFGGPGAGAGQPAVGGRGPGGGPFGGDSASLAKAVRYVKAHGGGTIAVESQSGAAGEIVSSGVRVAGIGGFSGRESQVSVDWLANAVRSGRIRWVLVSSGGQAGMPGDGRTGSRTAMAAVQSSCRRVLSVGGSGSSVLYDCLGRADSLARAG
jgi:4-amino-4-deoxy-L-arabinose transferase-like glycosyltransferase